ncbi:MAG TPA: hypothetical protein PKW82_03325 [Spirochaetales bacterium]|nr:hypothetical protein [Spirochaetales bacterium]
MNSDFHYYAVRAIAEAAGRPDADLIAWSSAWVDKAIHPYLVLEDGRRHECPATQNYVFWDERTRDEVYLPFHFVPGDAEAAARLRRDGARNPWAVTPNGERAKELMVAAMKSGDACRIGIAAHAFADTWAHQNFTARNEAFNALEPDSRLPAAGHLQALTRPDDPGGFWRDERLLPEASAIDNAARWTEAAKKLYRYFCVSMKRPFDDEDFLLEKLERVFRSPGGKGERRADWTIEFDLEPFDARARLEAAGLIDETAMDEPFRGYDKLLWLKAEAGRRLGGGEALREVRADGRFATSDLARFYEAADEHRALARKLCADL